MSCSLKRKHCTGSKSAGLATGGVTAATECRPLQDDHDDSETKVACRQPIPKPDTGWRSGTFACFTTLVNGTGRLTTETAGMSAIAVYGVMDGVPTSRWARVRGERTPRIWILPGQITGRSKQRRARRAGGACDDYTADNGR